MLASAFTGVAEPARLIDVSPLPLDEVVESRACARARSASVGSRAIQRLERVATAAGWIGTGVAASTFPAFGRPSSAIARAEADGTFTVQIGAADIGTAARTVLTQIAADELEAPLERVRVEIADSALPFAFLAGGSGGAAFWGSAVVVACRELRERLAAGEQAPVELKADTTEEIAGQRADLSCHAFGAQFAEVRVDADTGTAAAIANAVHHATGKRLRHLPITPAKLVS